MRAGAVPVEPEAVAFPIRLRHVLAVAVLGLVAWSGVPRLRAAFRLHTVATAFADYALCMVGPTGPSLLRDNPAAFRKLVRRRLVEADADDRPFAPCAKGAVLVTDSLSVERAHRASAASFVEYGGAAADGAPGALHLDDLGVTTRRLAEIADAAWPFVRGGYTSLVVPSAYAAEASYPIELPRPLASRAAQPAHSVTRCDIASNGGAFELGLSPDRGSKIVRTRTPEGISSDAILAPADVRVFGVSCDDRAAVVATGKPGTRAVRVFTCAYLGECTEMTLPRVGRAGPLPRYPLDVARVDGTTIIAVPSHGIVRVASSRDDGATWTPYAVVFDAEAHPETHFDVPVPDRLFVAGHRVWLYGATTRSHAVFPALASDDAGASFRTP